MDKFGVVTETENTKIASRDGQPCPGCGSHKVNYRGMTPHCPRCGTEPWEKRDSGKREEGRTYKG
jgi:hypothetical protein